MGLNVSGMVQEYIKEAGGADIRCFVVGGKVIAAMKRQALPGEFRSNLHRGGAASKVRITPQERPVRFDTYFFLAPMPADQVPLSTSEEVAESLWITPGRALEQSVKGALPLMPPTLVALGTLREFDP